MKLPAKILICALALSLCPLPAAPSFLPDAAQTVSAARAAASGRLDESVRWSFSRSTGVLTFRSLEEGEVCPTGLTIYEGKAYLYHSMPGSSYTMEEYCTDEWLAPWESYRDEIKRIELDQWVELPDDGGYFQSLASESIECRIETAEVGALADDGVNMRYERRAVSGYSWKYDVASDTLTYYGNGPHSYQHTAENENGGVYTTGTFSAFSPSDRFLRPGRVVLSDGITEAADFPDCDRLVLGDTAELGSDWEVRAAFEADPDNPHYTAYQGALYSKDGRTLIRVPTGMSEIPAHPNLEVLASDSLSGCAITSPLVIPWGVTVIETNALLDTASDDFTMTYVYPDTAAEINDDGDSRDCDTHRIISLQNPAAAGISYARSDRGAEATVEKAESVLSYYGITPGSWVTRGSRSWYIDENGRMAKGAVTIDGTEYRFDENGLLVSGTEPRPEQPDTGFVERDGNTYYYRDGVQLKGTYTYIDGKIYIFDEDGVMQKSGWYYLPGRDGGFVYLNDYGAGAVKCWRYRDGHYKMLEAGGTLTGQYESGWTGYSYLDAGGIAVSWNWVQDYGYWYYLDGRSIRYESRWLEQGGEWYWFGGSGKMAHSQWLRLNGKWYYFTDSGAMAHDTWLTKDGVRVYVGADGAMEE